MQTMKNTENPTQIAEAAAFRSSAVAQMAGMPVATLRIWEQRYRAVQPRTSHGGHRLYTALDLQRVMLLRSLTSQGHAISAIAALTDTQLRELAAQGRVTISDKKILRPLRLAVIGAGIALRLQRPALATRARQYFSQIDVYDDMSFWHTKEHRADLVLLQMNTLHPDLLPDNIDQARTTVIYRFAGSATIQTLHDRDISTLRDSGDDQALGDWLATLAEQMNSEPDNEPVLAAETETASEPSGPRYTEQQLTEIAGLNGSLACECPSHMAELLMQLHSFEQYSANCTNRHPEDAAMHRYLHQVAMASRMLFEDAMTQLMRHEGIQLPVNTAKGE